MKHFQNTSEANKLVQRFLDLSLAEKEFTHEAHLTVAAWYLIWFPLYKATDLIRENIQQFNIAKGGVNTDHQGYHETITFFYMQAIHQYLTTVDKEQDFADIVNKMLNNEVAHRKFISKFYSKKLLSSVKARKEYLQPDLSTQN